jgi:hypothetical protein
MAITRQTEQGEDKESPNRGVQLVIYGALASILLWLTVLIIGSPIMSLGSLGMSLLYTVLVSVPSIGVAAAALRKLSKESSAKKEAVAKESQKDVF